MTRKSFISICFTALFMMLMAVSNKAMALEVNGAWIQEEIEDTSKEWTIGFSKELGYDAMASGKISLNDENGRGLEVYLKLSDDKKSVKLIPAKAYKEGKMYCIKVASDLAFADNSLLGKDMSIPFRISKIAAESKGVGYIVDSYYQGNDTYVEIDMGGMEKSKLKVASTDAKIKDECIVQYSVNSDGSVDIKMDDFDGYKLYKGEVVKKDGSDIKLKGESGTFELKSDTIVYEEDYQKSKSSIYKGQKVEILAKDEEIYVVKITGENKNSESVLKSEEKAKKESRKEKKKDVKTDGEEHAGYILDAYRKGSEIYADIDNGSRKDYVVRGSRDIEEEYLVVFNNNSDGSVTIKENDFNEYKIYTGVVVEKEGSKITMNSGGDDIELTLSNDLVCYEGESEKSSRSIRENGPVQVLAKGKEACVVKIIDESDGGKVDESGRKYIGYIVDLWEKDGEKFVRMDYQHVNGNEKMTKEFKVTKESSDPHEHLVYWFNIKDGDKFELGGTIPEEIKMYGGEVLGVQGDYIIYTDWKKEYAFKFTDQTICYSEDGEKISLDGVKKNVKSRIFVKGNTIVAMELYFSY